MNVWLFAVQCLWNVITFNIKKLHLVNMYIKTKCSLYRPSVAQRVGRVIVLLFHDRGTGMGWVVSSTPRPHFTPGKDSAPTVQEAGWTPVSIWTGGKSRPHRNSILDRPARSQSLYRLSYPACMYFLRSYNKQTAVPQSSENYSLFHVEAANSV